MRLDERRAAQAEAGLVPHEEVVGVTFVSNAPELVATLRQERVLRERQLRSEKLHALSVQLGVIAELIAKSE